MVAALASGAMPAASARPRCWPPPGELDARTSCSGPAELVEVAGRQEVGRGRSGLGTRRRRCAASARPTCRTDVRAEFAAIAEFVTATAVSEPDDRDRDRDGRRARRAGRRRVRPARRCRAGRGQDHAGPGDRLPAEPPARRGLVAGRARDQRHDGRRGPDAAAVPRRSGPTTETAAAARWIRSSSGADGTWANFHGGDADLSTTVEAYVALRLAGDDPQAPHMAAAAAWVTRARAGSRPAGSSPGSGWPCSASGPGTTCRSCRRS